MADAVRAGRASSGDEQLVVFDIGGESFGVGIDRIREIIPMVPVTHIPRAPAFVRGVIDLRGAVIPVVDLRERFGLPAAEEGRERRIIVVEMAGQMVGCTVDDVSEVLTIPSGAVEPPPPVAMSIDSGYLLGVARHEERLIILLDLDKVLSEGEQEALAGAELEQPALPPGEGG